MQKIIYINGTHCPACKKLIERKILGILDVTDVIVDFESGKTIVDSTREIGKEEINKALEGMPYAQKD